MKSIFRNHHRPKKNGNFLVMSTSFDSTNKNETNIIPTAEMEYDPTTNHNNGNSNKEEDHTASLRNEHEDDDDLLSFQDQHDNDDDTQRNHNHEDKNTAPMMMTMLDFEACKSFQEDDDHDIDNDRNNNTSGTSSHLNHEDEPMVEVCQSDKGNSIILGNDSFDQIIVEKDGSSSVTNSRHRSNQSWFGRYLGWMAISSLSSKRIGNNNNAVLPRKQSTHTQRSDDNEVVSDTPDSGSNNNNNNNSSNNNQWTKREKILLWITLFNTVLIIVLLGNNASLVAQKNQTKSTSFAAANDGTDGCPTVNGNNNNSNIDATPPSEWKPANTTSDNSGSGGSGPVPAPTPTTIVQNTTVDDGASLGDPNFNCGCSACTDEMWNTQAGEFTCGDRITYLYTSLSSQYPTEVHACRQVAFEYPCACGSCDPSRCNIPSSEFILPSNFVPPMNDKFGIEITPAPTPANVVVDPNIRQEDQPLYCFPDASGRVSYTLWDGMIIQPKMSETPCGPGNNFFTSNTVVVDTTANTLSLLYANGVGSEVRVLLPVDQRPYTYGTYQFSVKSVEILNSAGTVMSTRLPKELVLGLFTWDPFESYGVHENYNHEVDIEISRWNCDSNSDLQYLVQPPGFPQMHRLFTGNPLDTDESSDPYNQGGHVYEFTWNPGQIDWTSTAGVVDVNNNFVLKTQEAIYRNVDDYVQCLPDRGGNTEVRMNLWNMLGPAQPVGLSSTDIVKVVIDNFTFVPSDQTHIPVGGICSKHCQCEIGVAQCIHNVCTVAS